MNLIDTFRAIIAIERAAPKRPKSIAVRRVEANDVGRGFVDPRQREGVRRLAITLDDDTFNRVRRHATARHISFAAAARELIERGFSAKSNEGVA
jgi:hypothetical protein